ncbi:MAG TPA: hypothetical protein VK960_07715, partial [Acidimicrobiia bacterium]|nr:hypothetical protein [Acidimicrobiia bacterium]
MTDIATDLIALTRLAPEPLRSEDAAAALGTDVLAVEVTGEALVADGVLAFEDGGFVVGPRAQTAPASPIRETTWAVALAEALEARHADPGEVGLLYARAARWERARDPLAEAALQTTTDG